MSKSFKFFMVCLILTNIFGCGKNDKNTPIQSSQTVMQVTSGSSNEGTISGKVYVWDQATGTVTPIAGAEVVVGDKRTKSEGAGDYILTGLPPGEITISSLAVGCRAYSITCNASKVNFYLIDEEKEVNLWLLLK